MGRRTCRKLDGWLLTTRTFRHIHGNTCSTSYTNGVIKQDANGEIHLYNKFWNWETDNRTVPAILIYADLMGSGNSRCLEAAQRILRNELKDFE